MEAIVNSRPLSPLSPDPNLQPLTPSHFLIGRPLNVAVDENYTTVSQNQLSAFQRMQQLTQHFWNRYNKEYINSLQPRGKWRNFNSKQPEEGDLVIIKEEGSAPANWRLGRISKLWPGKDGQIRIASVKTSSGEVKRPTVKLCPLPVIIN